MLSVRPFNLSTPRTHICVSYAPWLGRTTKMVVSCCAYGCANCFGARQELGFYRFPTFPEARRKQRIWAVKREVWAPSKYSRICGNHFVSGKLTVYTSKLTLDFSRARLILKLLHINICSYPVMFCTVLPRQASG